MRPKYISVTVYKPQVNTRLGMLLETDIDTGDVKVVELRESGILHASPLRVGDTILTINGDTISGLEQDEVIDLLRSLVGTITIVALNEQGDPNLVVSMVEKTHPSEVPGVGIRENRKGQLMVSDIHPTGLFADSLLASGDILSSINGVPCRGRAVTEVRRILFEATEYWSIVACTPVNLMSWTSTWDSSVFPATSTRSLVNPPVPPSLRSIDSGNEKPFFPKRRPPPIIKSFPLPLDPVDVPDLSPKPSLSSSLDPSPTRTRHSIQKPRPAPYLNPVQESNPAMSSRAVATPPPSWTKEPRLSQKQHEIIPASSDYTRPNSKVPPRIPGKKYKPVEVKLEAPDLYGQKHPIESPELWLYKLQQMDAEVEKIPAEDKTDLLEAQRRCPELLTDDFKLAFLRADVYDAEASAKRWCLYWERRRMVFQEAAFLPLTIKNCLKPEDYEFFERSIVNFVRIGDRLCYLSKMKNYRGFKQTVESNMRCSWYINHANLEDDVFQRKGVILFSYWTDAKMSDVDRDLLVKSTSSYRGAGPLRLSAYHLVNTPRVIVLAGQAAMNFIPPRMRKRFHFHNGTPAQIGKRLEKFGTKTEELPKELGGVADINGYEWFKQRLAEGK